MKSTPDRSTSSRLMSSARSSSSSCRSSPEMAMSRSPRMTSEHESSDCQSRVNMTAAASGESSRSFARADVVHRHAASRPPGRRVLSPITRGPAPTKPETPAEPVRRLRRSVRERVPQPRSRRKGSGMLRSHTGSDMYDVERLKMDPSVPFIEFRIPPDPAYVRIARLAAGDMGGRVGFSIDELDDVRLAVDEMCAILIGARGDVLEIRMQARGRTLIVEARVRGRACRDHAVGPLRDAARRPGRLVRVQRPGTRRVRRDAEARPRDRVALRMSSQAETGGPVNALRDAGDRGPEVEAA